MIFNWNDVYDAYMEKNFPKNKGIYDRLSDLQRKVVQEYFRWRTVTLFDQAYKVNRLTISKSKTKKLVEATGGAEDWRFAGIIDLGCMCGKCSLGHPLRYQYHAYSPSLKKEILFGSTCASDFFEIDPEMLRQMDNIRKETFEEVRKMLFIHYTSRTDEFKRLNYKNFPSPVLNNEEVLKRIKGFMGSGFTVMNKIMDCGLPLPKYFVEMLNRFISMESRNKELLNIMGDLGDEYKRYIMTCINNPDTFKPYKFIHEEFGIAISRGKINGNTSKQLLCSMIKTGLRLHRLRGDIKDKILVYSKDEYERYCTVFYVKSGDKLVPAYQNQIDNNTKGLIRKYACMLPEALWEGVSAVVWCCKGGDNRLKNAFREARAKNYNKNVIQAYTKMLDSINKTLDLIDGKSYDLRQIIEDYAKEIEEVQKINRMINNDIKVEVDAELEEAWEYLRDNIGKVKYDGVVDILRRYEEPYKLSQKQRDFVVNVYKKMIKDVQVAKNQAPVEQVRPLADTKNNTRMLVHMDGNRKRCAVVISNDACRPQIARKIMPNMIVEATSLIEELEKGAQIIYTNNSSKDWIRDVINEYSHTKEGKVCVDDYSYTYLPEVIGLTSLPEIQNKQNFSKEDMNKYTRNVFREEGVLDKFLEGVTSMFLEYRRVIRQRSAK